MVHLNCLNIDECTSSNLSFKIENVSILSGFAKIKSRHGAIFDVSKLKDTEFSEVPYKTLLKILNRLEEEGLLKPVSKGVYFIGEKPVDEELIFDEYVDNGKGMFVGYQLFNDVGISDYFDCKIEIYTNNIKSKQKSVGQYFLKKVDLEFDDDTVDLVALVDIIDTGYSMKGCDFMAYKKTVDMLLKSYSDSSFEKIVKAIHYKYSTIKQLSEFLEANSIDNNCLNIFESTYKNSIR